MITTPTDGTAMAPPRTSQQDVPDRTVPTEVPTTPEQHHLAIAAHVTINLVFLLGLIALVLGSAA